MPARVGPRSSANCIDEGGGCDRSRRRVCDRPRRRVALGTPSGLDAGGGADEWSCRARCDGAARRATSARRGRSVERPTRWDAAGSGVSREVRIGPPGASRPSGWAQRGVVVSRAVRIGRPGASRPSGGAQRGTTVRWDAAWSGRVARGADSAPRRAATVRWDAAWSGRVARGADRAARRATTDRRDAAGNDRPAALLSRRDERRPPTLPTLQASLDQAQAPLAQTSPSFIGCRSQTPRATRGEHELPPATPQRPAARR